MLFSKLNYSTGTPLFSKLNGLSGTALFRKGYNTLGKISSGIDTFGKYASGLAPAISAYNPAIGAISGSLGGLAPTISQSLNSLVKSAKNIKRIEKGKPSKY